MFKRQDFPADPVVKEPHFQWGRGRGRVRSIPGQGRSHIPCGAAKSFFKKKKRWRRKVRKGE